MARISSIRVQEKNSSRCNVYVDGEFFAGISLELVMQFRLKVDMEIDKKLLYEILNENEKKDALNKAISYISKTLKTKRQIKDYLIKKGYSEDVAWCCVDKLKEYGYIDDCSYSKRYIESLSKSQGRRLIEYKLMMKGVKKEDISSAYEEIDVDSKESAKLIAEKYLKNKEKTKETIAKAYRYLIGKGFSYEEVEYALSQFKEDY